MALNSLFCADVPLSNYSLTLMQDVLKNGGYIKTIGLLVANAFSLVDFIWCMDMLGIFIAHS